MVTLGSVYIIAVALALVSNKNVRFNANTPVFIYAACFITLNAQLAGVLLNTSSSLHVHDVHVLHDVSYLLP